MKRISKNCLCSVFKKCNFCFYLWTNGKKFIFWFARRRQHPQLLPLLFSSRTRYFSSDETKLTFMSGERYVVACSESERERERERGSILSCLNTYSDQDSVCGRVWGSVCVWRVLPPPLYFWHHTQAHTITLNNTQQHTTTHNTRQHTITHNHTQ